MKIVKLVEAMYRVHFALPSFASLLFHFVSSVSSLKLLQLYCVYLLCCLSLAQPRGAGTDGTVEGTVKINQTYPKPDYPNPTEYVGLQNYPFFPFGNHLVFLGYTSCSGGGGSHHPGCQVGFWILHNISSGFSPTMLAS